MFSVVCSVTVRPAQRCVPQYDRVSSVDEGTVGPLIHTIMQVFRVLKITQSRPSGKQPHQENQHGIHRKTPDFYDPLQ